MSSTLAQTPILASNYFQLAGKIALVTGASSGLGRHFANILAEAGAVVALAARRVDRLQEISAELNARGLRSLVIEMDVTDHVSIRDGFAKTMTEVGPVEVVVNNAGVTSVAPFLEASEADTDQVFDTNLRAAWRVGQMSAQIMAKSGAGGSIINVASILGMAVMPGLASYCVSKAAVIQLTKVMALELARHKIRVNAVAPGYFKTDMNREFLTSDRGQEMIKTIPLRRVGNLEDLDATLLLLASPRGAYITGSVISIDGGHLLIAG